MTPRAANSLSVVDVFAALKDLNGAANVKASFERLGKLLAAGDCSGTISAQLVDEDEGEQKTSQFVVSVANGKAKTSSERPDKPDIEFITTTATWQEVTAGKLTPQEAFFKGRMRLRGKAELARELFKRPAKVAGNRNEGKGEK